MSKKISQYWVQEHLANTLCDYELNCGYPEFGDCPEECPIAQMMLVHPDNREFEVKTIEELEAEGKEKGNIWQVMKGGR